MVEGNLLLGAIAGLIGTAFMTLLMYILKAAGQKLDFPYLLGSRFVAIENKSKIYSIGLLLHFLAGAAWGAMYVLTLTAIGFEANWPAGILWGFAHGIFIGVVMSTIAEDHPNIGKGKAIEDPGILGSNWGVLMPYWILGLHVIFGIVTLISYQLMFNP